MSIKTKIAAVALAAVTLAGTFTVSSEAQARPRWGAVVGAGIATGLILGAAAASSPAYAYGYRRCHWVRNYDAYGYYVGKSRVCHH
jgi:hypothetical protein